ncbi:alpha/beta hydrolase fold domain-containing protein [Arthrobacter sp. StoSoilB20]|uniref:alpha/beta hydrolase n=1 Tax=Arthrobacter sp. StoSoilB20 TaxID=2830995 RepID=UPI001CC449D0|nr:alpha/beta hydrolase fold domain-containing protein [Arthrobacter sp. StoSoilB20]BCW58631.1 esterase [Arthrobacter sp. StoSoilB20]
MTENAVHAENRRLQGPYGEIPVRLYNPAGPRPEPLGLVWCHGGAFIYGDLDMAESDWVATTLAEAGISVVAVDYRLAPVPQWALDLDVEPGTGDAYYPVAIDEIEAVLDWANTELHLQSPAGWALGGASAGGTLTAGLTLRLRDQGLAMPSRLLLAYPLLHPALPKFSTELQIKLAATTPGTGIPLTPQGVEGLTLNYVNGNPQQLADPYAFPGGHDLTGFPPTFVLNSDVDTIRSSGDAFAAELAGAGVDLLTVREHGTDHGHLNEPTTVGAQRSVQRMIEWLTSPWAYSQPTDSSLSQTEASVR